MVRRDWALLLHSVSFSLSLLFICYFIKASLSLLLFSVAILFGFWNCFGVITIDFSSVLSGILQICVGVFVMAIEAPVCCMFVDFVQDLAKQADRRPYWNRAAVYCA